MATPLTPDQQAHVDRFQAGEISGGKLANLLGVSRWDIDLWLRDHGIEPTDVTSYIIDGTPEADA